MIDAKHENHANLGKNDDDMQQNQGLLASAAQFLSKSKHATDNAITANNRRPKSDTQRSEADLHANGSSRRRTAKNKRFGSSVRARTVLWYLTFIGFGINYMIRINMNITIVDMILPATKSVLVNNVITARLEPECYVSIAVNQSVLLHSNGNQSIGVMSVAAGHRAERFSIERKCLDWFGIDYDKYGFDWNEYRQGLLLGSFFWMHWVTQIPGGVLARKYGTKLIFGVANLLGCLLCALMPICAYLDYTTLLVLRVVQGCICGLAWPAMHAMTSKWIPPNERSKFVTAYLGSSVGVAVFYPLFGLVISISSWEWVYYLCTLLGSMWFVGWQYFVYDSPAQHPRIDPAERFYIEESLGTSVQSKGATPWKSILTSRAVWVICIAQWGGIWGLFTVMTQAPTYFKIIHGLNMNMTGLLSGLPHLMRMSFAFVFSIFGDFLLTKNLMSRTNVRKLAGTFCLIINGLLIAGLAFSGCNTTAAISLLITATALHGAVSTGPLASLIDISPNFSGITLGLTGMISVMPGFISPLIVGRLTLNNQTIEQWKYVFLITATTLLVCGSIYLLFSESNLADWNMPLGCEKAVPVSQSFQDLSKKHNPNCSNTDEKDVLQSSSDDENTHEREAKRIA